MNCLQNIILDHRVNITLYKSEFEFVWFMFFVVDNFQYSGVSKASEVEVVMSHSKCKFAFHQIIRPSNAPVWKFNLLSVIFEVMRCVLGSELNLGIWLQGFIQTQDIIWGEELQTLWERPWTPISGGCYTSRLTKQLHWLLRKIIFPYHVLTTASCERNARNGGNLELLGKNTKMRKYF